MAGMVRARIIEDPDRRWRRFGRAGRRMAVVAAAAWFGMLALLLGTAPAPGPLPRVTPPRVVWWPGADPSAGQNPAADPRVAWSPSVFALPGPAGFSHRLRRDRARLAPPDQPLRPGPAYLEADAAALPPGTTDRAGLRSAPAAGLPPAPAADPVFPPRAPGEEPSRMVFPDGWEARLFSGVDPGFGAWAGQAWSAVLDLRFDADGVPQSVLLVQPSGLPGVDGRLARSARGWRLLDARAPRQGRVGWYGAAPAPAPEAAP